MERCTCNRMRFSKFSNNQIIAILKQNEEGVSVPNLCHDKSMSNAALYKWRAKFGGMEASMMKRMKNLRLKIGASKRY